LTSYGMLLLLTAVAAAPVNKTRTTFFGVRPSASTNPNTYIKTVQAGTYPEGFAEEDYNGAEGTITGGSSITVKGNVRTYWTEDSTQHDWGSIAFKKLNLLGKSLRFTADLSRVGCGCNAALYFVAMGATGSGDSSGYCDIQGVGGNTCLEIDILEGNLKAIQTTLHTQTGIGTDGTCNQYGCNYNWGLADQSNYGIGSMIDSSRSYSVDAAFDQNGHMTVQLGQDGQWHDFWNVNTAGNGNVGVPEDASYATKLAMENGVVLAISLWESEDDMAWLNGACNSQYPHCDLNSASMVFSDLKVVGGSDPKPNPPPKPPSPPPTLAPPPPPSPPPPPPADECSYSTNMQCQGGDISDAGYKSSVGECCQACLETSSCKAFTWNRGYDQHCWLKTQCATHYYDSNCDSGYATSTPTSTCSKQTNTQCQGNDIRDAGVVSSASACCDACAATDQCKAWTWNRGYDQHCFVKYGCNSQASDYNCDSGFINTYNDVFIA